MEEIKETPDKKTVVDNKHTSQKSNQFKSYLIKVTSSALNIRKGPSMNCPVSDIIRDKGEYLILEERHGWGRIESGWISLKYCKKI